MKGEGGQVAGGRSGVHRASAGPRGAQSRGHDRAGLGQRGPAGACSAARQRRGHCPFPPRTPSPTARAHPRPPSPNGNVRTSAGRDVPQRSQWTPQREPTKTCLRHARDAQYVTVTPQRVLPRPPKPGGNAAWRSRPECLCQWFIPTGKTTPPACEH